MSCSYRDIWILESGSLFPDLRQKRTEGHFKTWYLWGKCKICTYSNMNALEMNLFLPLHKELLCLCSSLEGRVKINHIWKMHYSYHFIAGKPLASSEVWRQYGNVYRTVNSGRLKKGHISRRGYMGHLLSPHQYLYKHCFSRTINRSRAQVKHGKMKNTTTFDKAFFYEESPGRCSGLK